MTPRARRQPHLSGDARVGRVQRAHVRELRRLRALLRRLAHAIFSLREERLLAERRRRARAYAEQSLPADLLFFFLAVVAGLVLSAQNFRTYIGKKSSTGISWLVMAAENTNLLYMWPLVCNVN